MLLKNDLKTKVPAEFVKSFTKPVTFELCESQTATNPATKKRQFPRSRTIEPFYTLFEKNESVTWRFAENKKPAKVAGEVDYVPTEIEFLSKGNMVLSPQRELHIELYYWLTNHPQNASGPNKDENKAFIFYQIDEQKKSKDRISTAKTRHQSEHLILSEWSITQLREIAFGFGDTLAGEKTQDQLQDYLLQVMERDIRGFYEKATSDDMTMRANIVEGQALNVIAYHDGERAWNWVTPEGDKKTEICRVPTEQDPKTRLIKFFNTSLKEENEEYFMDKLTKARAATKEALPKEKAVA